jgi:hypothetical protein
MEMRNILTTTAEVLGGILVVLGVGAFSIPAAVITSGVLLIVLGGILA